MLVESEDHDALVVEERRCSLITAGVVWSAASGAFQVEMPAEPQTALSRLGENARRARYGLDLSQQALSDIATMSRGDLVDFERGSRNFGIFTVIRLARVHWASLSVNCLPA
jgi:hypothetical protein